MSIMINPVRFMCIILILVCALKDRTAFALQSNLIQNGNFELDADEDNVPDYWKTRGSINILQKLTLGPGREGGHSAQLLGERFLDTGSNAHFMLTQKEIVSLEKGKYYKLTFWAKQSGIRTGTISVGLRSSKNHGKCGFDVMINVKRDQWQKFEYVFKTTCDCSSNCDLQFWYRETGILWVDDVELENTTSQSYKPANIQSCIACKNFIYNSGFECGLDGWGSTTTESGMSYGGLDELIGKIDSNIVYQGQNSLRIDLSPETFPQYNFDYFHIVQKKVRDPLIMNEGWIPVEKDKEYVLSAYLKTDTEGLKARMGIKNFQSKIINTEIKNLSTEWKRFSVTVRPESEYCCVVVGPDFNLTKQKRGAIWIDGIQFEENSKASSYEPSKPVEIGLELNKTTNIFNSGETIHIISDIRNNKKQNIFVDFKFELLDFFDTRINTISFNKNVEPEMTLSEKTDIGTLPTGFYSIKATINEKNIVIKKKRLRLAVVPKRNIQKSIFGVNHAYGKSNILKLAKSGGIDWCRTWSLMWQEVEPQRGRYDFTKTDFEVKRLVQNYIEILGLIPLPSNKWSYSSPPYLKFTSKTHKQLDKMAYMPKDGSEFAEYIKKIVERYKSEIRYWQILNEPLGYSLPRKNGYMPIDYLTLEKIAWQTIKELDPLSKVLIGFRGLGSKQLLDDFKSVFDKGILNYCDIITVHCYPELLPPELFEEPLKELNSLMEQYGKKKSIWITEHGYYADDDLETVPTKPMSPITPLNDEKMQACYAIRFATIARANGVQKIFYHAGNTSRLNQENLQGIFFEYGGRPRKIYAALSIYANLLPSDAIFEKEIALGDGIKSYLFRLKNDLILVTWKTDAKKSPVIVSSSTNIQTLNFMGNVMPRRKVPIIEYPIYIIAKGISVEQFESFLSIKQMRMLRPPSIHKN